MARAVRVVLAVVGVVTIGLPGPGAGVAAAAAAAPGTSTPTVLEARDYASQNWADQWDFANIEDFYTQPRTASAGTLQTSATGIDSVSASGGVLNFRQPGTDGYVDFGFFTNGSIPLQRDTRLHPIDTGTYNRLAMRVKMDNASAGPQLILIACEVFTGPSCFVSGIFLQGATSGQWSTATANLPARAAVYSVRFYAFSAGNVQIDWLRLVNTASGSDVNLTMSAAASSTWWYRRVGGDCATNPLSGANPPEGRDQGRIAGALGAGQVATFQASLYPPGEYCARSYSGGSWSDPAAISVKPRPQPVVIDPDVGGGDDWAATVRGDAWDFSQPSDVAWVNNANVSVSGGQAHGSSAGAYPNDPMVGLPTAGPIDAVTYHRATVKVTYDGGWSLEDAPGGGMNARLLWVPTASPDWSNSDDLVVFPGSNTFQFDLKTDPPSAVNDPASANRVGWGGPLSAQVAEVRFDPHEDPGARTWHLDDIRIARNDRGKPSFPITFADNAWMAGATANIYVDRDYPGNVASRRQIAANLPVTAGTNTFVWNGTDTAGAAVAAPATWWVLLSIDHPVNGPVNAQAYGTGPVDMPVQPVLPPGAPTNLSATAGVESADLSWTPPANQGGAPITSYVVTVSPGGGKVVVGNVTSTTVTGLDPGVAHTFTVAARNSGGTGPASNTAGPVVPAALGGAGFVPVTPYRVLDSRNATGGWNNSRLGQGQVRDVTVGTGQAGKVPADAVAVVMNVTVTGPTAPSYLTAYPSGAPRPTAANLNFLPGQTVPNLVTTKLGNAGKVSFYNDVGATHVVADVVGYYTVGSGDGFAGVTPVRALDSRELAGAWGGQRLGAGEARNLQVADVAALGVPADATSVVLNVTATAPTDSSYVQVYPAGSTPGVTANLLVGAGQTVPNLVTVGVGAAGEVTFFNQLGQLHLVVDVMGYYAPSVTGGAFHAVNPKRVLDSRTATGGWGGKLGANAIKSLQVAGTAGIPAGISGAVMNTTVTQGTSLSYLAAVPAPGTPPVGTANVLFAPGQTVPNLVVVRVPADGDHASMVDVFNQKGQVHVIADLAGYFS